MTTPTPDQVRLSVEFLESAGNDLHALLLREMVLAGDVERLPWSLTTVDARREYEYLARQWRPVAEAIIGRFRVLNAAVERGEWIDMAAFQLGNEEVLAIAVRYLLDAHAGLDRLEDLLPEAHVTP